MEEYEVEIEMDCGRLTVKLVAPYASSNRVLLAIAADIVADELTYARVVGTKKLEGKNIPSRKRMGRADER